MFYSFVLVHPCHELCFKKWWPWTWQEWCERPLISARWHRLWVNETQYK